MAVYFIRCGESGPVKIGWAVNPLQRLHELQCAHHEQLTIIRLLDGARPEESRLHAYFRPLRVRNEWFRYHPLMETVEVPPDCDEPSPYVAASRLVIDVVGGPAKLASALNLPAGLATHWSQRGIPAKYWHRLAGIGAPLGGFQMSEIYHGRGDIAPSGAV